MLDVHLVYFDGQHKLAVQQMVSFPCPYFGLRFILLAFSAPCRSGSTLHGMKSADDDAG